MGEDIIEKEKLLVQKKCARQFQDKINQEKKMVRKLKKELKDGNAKIQDIENQLSNMEYETNRTKNRFGRLNQRKSEMDTFINENLSLKRSQKELEGKLEAVLTERDTWNAENDITNKNSIITK